MVRDRKENDGEGRRGAIPAMGHSPLPLYRIAAVVVLGRIPDAAAAAAASAVSLLVVPSAAAAAWRSAAAPRRHRHEDDHEEENAGGAADVDREVLLRDLPRAHAQRERRVGRRRGGRQDGGRRGGSGRRRRGNQGRGGELKKRRGHYYYTAFENGHEQILISEERETKVTRAFPAGGGRFASPKH